MPRKGRKRKKTRTHVTENENAQNTLSSAEDQKVPRSLVIRRGKTEHELIDLVSNLRQLMCPYTALHFKEDATNRKNTLSHYSKELTSTMGITHILSLSQNESKVNLRLARTPAGPTLSFQVKQFSLMKHVKAIQRRPFVSEMLYHHSPVVITNNFGDASAAPHVKLMRITFQNMFPVINVAKVKLSDCRRVVLFNYIRTKKQHEPNDDDDDANNDTNNDDEEEEDEVVEVRHYAIRATPVGVNRKVRRLIQSKIPNLSKLEDISDYITGVTSTGETAPPAPLSSGNASDSEPEDETSHVTLPQSYAGKGNAKSQTSALKLVELGPRLKLKLFKVERGLSGGDVMYHAFVKKTRAEAQALKERKEKELMLKKMRREEQEANVARKMEVKEEKRERKRRRKEEREREMMDSLRGVENDEDESDDDDDGEDEGNVHADHDDSDDDEDDDDDEEDASSSSGEEE